MTRTAASLAATRLAVAGLAAIPGLTFAHGLSDAGGMGGLAGFYRGLLHPVAVPAHLLGLLALALFHEQQGPGGAALALPRIAAGCAVGLALAVPDAGIGIQMLLFGAIALMGIVIAAAPRTPPAVAWMLTTTIAFAIVLDSAPDVPAVRDRLAALAGTSIAISAGFVWISTLLACLHRPWQRIGIRVVGSWTSAWAILILGLAAGGHLTGAAT